MNKKCRGCGADFEAWNPDREYCSSECRKNYLSMRARERYRLNSEPRREYSKYWAEAHPERRKATNLAYKERVRHENVKAKLTKNTGLVCSKCGKHGNTFEIVGHHQTHNPKEHDYQELLCRSCHIKEHDPVQFRRRNFTKEEIERAIAETKTLNDAAAKLGTVKSVLREYRKKYGLHLKPCATCGKQFEPNAKLLNYCSDCSAVLHPHGYVKFYVDKLKRANGII
jgi:endogenous inhibitor of DNA gyrase (YacG/DUF329 family)